MIICLSNAKNAVPFAAVIRKSRVGIKRRKYNIIIIKDR